MAFLIATQSNVKKGEFSFEDTFKDVNSKKGKGRITADLIYLGGEAGNDFRISRSFLNGQVEDQGWNVAFDDSVNKAYLLQSKPDSEFKTIFFKGEYSDAKKITNKTSSAALKSVIEKAGLSLIENDTYFLSAVSELETEYYTVFEITTDEPVVAEETAVEPVAQELSAEPTAEVDQLAQVGVEELSPVVDNSELI